MWASSLGSSKTLEHNSGNEGAALHDTSRRSVARRSSDIPIGRHPGRWLSTCSSLHGAGPGRLNRSSGDDDRWGNDRTAADANCAAEAAARSGNAATDACRTGPCSLLSPSNGSPELCRPRGGNDAPQPCRDFAGGMSNRADPRSTGGSLGRSCGGSGGRAAPAVAPRLPCGSARVPRG